MTEKTQALLACPRCGNHAFVAPSTAGYPVWCATDACLKLPARATEDEAIAAWNQRHRQSSSNAGGVGVDDRALQVADTIIPDTAHANRSPIQRQAYWHVAHNAAKLALNPAFTAEAIERATTETKRLQRELDVTNADHVAVWIEANTIPDEPMNQCASWLAVQIVEAHERALASLSTPTVHSREAHREGDPAWLVEALSTPTAEPMGGDDGEHLHAVRETPPSASAEAREVLARAFEPQFPVEAEKARKGLHFMLPSLWAVEAIQGALDAALTSSPCPGDGMLGDTGKV